MGMWWFGRKSAPDTVRPYVPNWLSSGLYAADAEEGFARSYEAQYDEVFRRNPVGQRAVRLVAGMLGMLTIDVAGDEQALALIRAEGLLEGLAASLLLQGNAYVQAVSEDGDKPTELVALRPERMSGGGCLASSPGAVSANHALTGAAHRAPAGAALP